MTTAVTTTDPPPFEFDAVLVDPTKPISILRNNHKPPSPPPSPTPEEAKGPLVDYSRFRAAVAGSHRSKSRTRYEYINHSRRRSSGGIRSLPDFDIGLESDKSSHSIPDLKDRLEQEKDNDRVKLVSFKMRRRIGKRPRPETSGEGEAARAVNGGGGSPNRYDVVVDESTGKRSVMEKKVNPLPQRNLSDLQKCRRSTILRRNPSSFANNPPTAAAAAAGAGTIAAATAEGAGGSASVGTGGGGGVFEQMAKVAAAEIDSNNHDSHNDHIDSPPTSRAPPIPQRLKASKSAAELSETHRAFLETPKRERGDKKRLSSLQTEEKDQLLLSWWLHQDMDGDLSPLKSSPRKKGTASKMPTIVLESDDDLSVSISGHSNASSSSKLSDSTTSSSNHSDHVSIESASFAPRSVASTSNPAPYAAGHDTPPPLPTTFARYDDKSEGSFRSFAEETTWHAEESTGHTESSDYPREVREVLETPVPQTPRSLLSPSSPGTPETRSLLLSPASSSPPSLPSSAPSSPSHNNSSQEAMNALEDDSDSDGDRSPDTVLANLARLVGKETIDAVKENAEGQASSDQTSKQFAEAAGDRGGIVEMADTIVSASATEARDSEEDIQLLEESNVPSAVDAAVSTSNVDTDRTVQLTEAVESESMEVEADGGNVASQLADISVNALEDNGKSNNLLPSSDLASSFKKEKTPLSDFGGHSSLLPSESGHAEIMEPGEMVSDMGKASIAQGENESQEEFAEESLGRTEKEIEADDRFEKVQGDECVLETVQVEDPSDPGALAPPTLVLSLLTEAGSAILPVDSQAGGTGESATGNVAEEHIDEVACDAGIQESAAPSAKATTQEESSGVKEGFDSRLPQESMGEAVGKSEVNPSIDQVSLPLQSQSAHTPRHDASYALPDRNTAMSATELRSNPVVPADTCARRDTDEEPGHESPSSQAELFRSKPVLRRYASLIMERKKPDMSSPVRSSAKPVLQRYASLMKLNQRKAENSDKADVVQSSSTSMVSEKEQTSGDALNDVPSQPAAAVESDAEATRDENSTTAENRKHEGTQFAAPDLAVVPDKAEFRLSGGGDAANDPGVPLSRAPPQPINYAYPYRSHSSPRGKRFQGGFPSTIPRRAESSPRGGREISMNRPRGGRIQSAISSLGFSSEIGPSALPHDGPEKKASLPTAARHTVTRPEVVSAAGLMSQAIAEEHAEAEASNHSRNSSLLVSISDEFSIEDEGEDILLPGSEVSPAREVRDTFEHKSAPAMCLNPEQSDNLNPEQSEKEEASNENNKPMVASRKKASHAGGQRLSASASVSDPESAESAPSSKQTGKGKSRKKDVESRGKSAKRATTSTDDPQTGRKNDRRVGRGTKSKPEARSKSAGKSRSSSKDDGTKEGSRLRRRARTPKPKASEQSANDEPSSDGRQGSRVRMMVSRFGFR